MDCPEMNIGIPSPGYEFAVINPETGKYCAVGENGDLYIRGNRGIQLFLEYYKNPEAMKKSFTADGWFATGDQVRLGEDGYMYFADRDKDVLKVGGENVSARQVEEAINAAAPYMFAEVAVVAQKHEMLDEIPVAFIIKGAFCTQSDDEMRTIVMDYCTKNLADFKRPRKLYFIKEEEMPRATLEKVAKNKLREMSDALADEEAAAKK
jgi:crotonobetaine/carnitine-CoA ligase